MINQPNCGPAPFLAFPSNHLKQIFFGGPKVYRWHLQLRLLMCQAWWKMTPIITVTLEQRWGRK